MEINCTTVLQPKITFNSFIAYCESRIEFAERNVRRYHKRIGDWYVAPGTSASKAVMAAFDIAKWKNELLPLKQNFVISHLNPSFSVRFLLEYSNNLTRLDGSRLGPVGLLSNAFAISDCLSAGRFNNADVLREQAIQLLGQRAYKDQEIYAEEIELAKDPINEVEFIPQRLFCFVQELMGVRAGQEMQPWAEWDIVGDQDYIKAARAVYTEDMEEAAQTLCQLCNLHIQHSSPFPGELELDSLVGYEFDSPLRAIWPTEIFAWLRVRQERGLELPQVNHPLLDQPLGQFQITPPRTWEYEPWFVELIQKLTELHPLYADLPRLVFDQP